MNNQFAGQFEAVERIEGAAAAGMLEAENLPCSESRLFDKKCHKPTKKAGQMIYPAFSTILVYFRILRLIPRSPTNPVPNSQIDGGRGVGEGCCCNPPAKFRVE